MLSNNNNFQKVCGTLVGTTIKDQSELGSNGNKGETLHFSELWETGASLPDVV